MIEIVKGQIYRAKRVRTGTSSMGDWMMVAVEDPKSSKREMPIWVQNIPCKISDGEQFKVLDITASKYSWKKDKQTDKWAPDISVKAIIKPISSEFSEMSQEVGTAEPIDEFKTFTEFSADEIPPWDETENELPL